MKRIAKKALDVNNTKQMRLLRSQKQVSKEAGSSEASSGTSDVEAKDVDLDSEPEDKSVDLSKFKFVAKKGKLSSISSPEIVKREHVKVEYDDNSSSQLSESKMPSNWELVINNLREMRKNSDAPVDTMGCDQCHDENAPEEDKRFQILLSLMLSSQTKDETTHAAMLRLREHGCSVTNILNTSDEKLGELIYPVSFWKTKVKNIKKTADLIKTTYNGDIPKTVEDLCKLHGVGPKMAHLCMNTAWGEVTGIGVDVHVHRISNRLGWVKTKTPEETRGALERWLPRDLWSEVNHILVGFGQTICKAEPRCGECLNNTLCPFAKKGQKSNKKK